MKIFKKISTKIDLNRKNRELKRIVEKQKNKIEELEMDKDFLISEKNSYKSQNIDLRRELTKYEINK